MSDLRKYRRAAGDGYTHYSPAHGQVLPLRGNPYTALQAQVREGCREGSEPADAREAERHRGGADASASLAYPSPSCPPPAGSFCGLPPPAHTPPSRTGRRRPRPKHGEEGDDEEGPRRHRRLRVADEDGVPPLPRMQDIVAHRRNANRSAAEALRDMIEDDASAPPQTPAPAHHNVQAPVHAHPTPPTNPHTLTPRQTSIRAAPRFATGANAYASPANRRSGFGPGHKPASARQTETFPHHSGESNNAKGFPQAPGHSAFPRTKQTQDTFHKAIRRFRKYDKYHSGLHTLQHVGGGDQVDEWRAQNHHLLVGQDGADLESEETGCDLLMPRTAGVVPAVHLDPDLPPLSAEHPARVWNAMLHALTPEFQPIIRWEYDDAVVGQEGAFIARMTILLPPTHPAVAGQTVANALPKDRYSPEYARAMAVLGGVRTWVGPARKLKADAQNTTITMCISENALDWVHAPLTVAVEERLEKITAATPCIDLGVKLVRGTTASIEIQHDHDVEAYGCMLTVGREPHFQHYVEDTVHRSTEDALEAVRRRAVKLNVRAFLAWLQGTEDVEIIEDAPGAAEDGRIEIDDQLSASNGLASEHDAPDVFENISATGNTDASDDMGVDAFPSIRREATATTEEGERGGDTSEPDAPMDNRSARSCVTDDGAPPSIRNRPATPIPHELQEVELFVPRTKPEEMDWQTQLACFCHLSGLPPPTYSQRIMRRPGQTTLFVGKVTVEEETYESADGHETILTARQSVARQVFTETFGQEAAAVTDMPPAFRP